MTTTLTQEFQQAPSAWRFMADALRSRPGLVKAGGVPAIVLTWRDWKCGGPELAAISELTGLGAQQPLSILAPHILTFRLNMALLTHPAFPLPLLGALQIRNQLLQHHAVQPGTAYCVSTAVAGQRVLEKGAEVDLHTQVSQDGQVLWESLNTFYYRGRFGPASPPSAGAASPAVRGEETRRWHAPGGSGWRFGGLTGDYNGIHWSRQYARAFGFRRDFHNPPRVLGQCLAHLGQAFGDSGQRLDTWLKGPVYYDADLRLQLQQSPDALCFALSQDQDERPAIVARWRRCGDQERLLEPLACS